MDEGLGMIPDERERAARRKRGNCNSSHGHVVSGTIVWEIKPRDIGFALHHNAYVGVRPKDRLIGPSLPLTLFDARMPYRALKRKVRQGSLANAHFKTIILKRQWKNAYVSEICSY